MLKVFKIMLGVFIDTKLERVLKEIDFRVIDLLSRNFPWRKSRKTSRALTQTSEYKSILSPQQHSSSSLVSITTTCTSRIILFVSFLNPSLIVLSFHQLVFVFTSGFTFVNLQCTSYFSIPIIVPFHNFYIFVLSSLFFQANISLLKSLKFFGPHAFHPPSSYVCILDG